MFFWLRPHFPITFNPRTPSILLTKYDIVSRPTQEHLVVLCNTQIMIYLFSYHCFQLHLKKCFYKGLMSLEGLKII